MKWYSIVADVVFFSPSALLMLGKVRWFRAHVSPRNWRENVIAVGLSFALVSCVCLYGVVLYLQKVRIGYWNEYVVASRWGRFSWPASLAAVILEVAGKGTSRVLLVMAASGLVVVWTMAFVH